MATISCGRALSRGAAFDKSFNSFHYSIQFGIGIIIVGSVFGCFCYSTV
jgi:hypothetical protein